MNKIYRFDEFVSIFEANKNIDINKQLLIDLKKITNQRIIAQWTNTPEFGGVYTKPSILGGEEIFYKWDGVEYSFPDIIYSNGNFFEKEKFNKGIKPDRLDNWEIRNKIWILIDDMIKRSAKASNFNPFENGVEDMPIIKELKAKGMEIISTDREKKTGTLVLRFPNAIYDYVIQTSGYIRRKGVSGFVSNKDELIKKIYSLEDLMPKLSYVYYLYIKDATEGEGIPKKDIEKIISLFFSEESTKSLTYKEEYDKIVQEHPKMALYLPEPEEGGNKELIKGAKILGRLGIF